MIMKKLFLFLMLTVISYSDTWHAFYEKKKNNMFGDQLYIGYKDKNNVIKIKPIFMGFSHAKKFDDIIAVMTESERNSTKYLQYYLTKSGRKVGKSETFKGIMYNSDATYDCENEGHIRFRKDDFIGLLDKNGDVSISAKYNYLSRVHNGLVIALHGAKKEYENKHKEDGCNHFFYKDGNLKVLNDKGKVLIKNFDDEKNTLDLYSLEITEHVSKKSYCRSYLGTDKKYYTFEIYTKKFLKWMDNNIFIDLSLKNILKNTHTGYIKKVKENINILKKTLEKIKNKSIKYYLSTSAVYSFEYKNKIYEKFFNNCGQYREFKYPSLTFYIRNNKGTNDYISFLKIDDNYHLIDFSLTNEVGK